MFTLIPTGLRLALLVIALIGALGTLGYCQKQNINRLNKEVKKNSIILDNKLLKADKKNQIFIKQLKKEIRETEVKPVNKEPPKDLEKIRQESFNLLRNIT